jgi:hypothetical protein
MELPPLMFIDEPIEVIFHRPPMLAKSPPCPDAFIWQGETYEVVEMLEMWQNFQRRGKMARNMQPEHAQAASRRGSWGVGRFFFAVRVQGGRIFEIYYDRTPEAAGDRMGHWVLRGERRLPGATE